MKIEIIKTPKDYDSDNLIIDGKKMGFVTKKEKIVGLKRCPKCGKENYVRRVMDGQCAWCGFDANQLKELK